MLAVARSWTKKDTRMCANIPHRTDLPTRISHHDWHEYEIEERIIEIEIDCNIHVVLVK